MTGRGVVSQDGAAGRGRRLDRVSGAFESQDANKVWVMARPSVDVCSTPFTNTSNFSGTVAPPLTVLRNPASGFTGA